MTGQRSDESLWFRVQPDMPHIMIWWHSLYISCISTASRRVYILEHQGWRASSRRERGRRKRRRMVRGVRMATRGRRWRTARSKRAPSDLGWLFLPRRTLRNCPLVRWSLDTTLYLPYLFIDSRELRWLALGISQRGKKYFLVDGLHFLHWAIFQ